MGEYGRGSVVKATFEIVYPDGNRKTFELEDPENVLCIAFDAAYVDPSALDKFNVSETDWEDNPTMSVTRRHEAGVRWHSYCHSKYSDCAPPPS